jgi:CubicO group peptidase (beta-lactamase class C family)
MVSIRSKKTGALAALFALFLLSCTIAVLAGYGYVLTAVHDTYMNGSLTPPITETGSTLTKNVREITAGTPQPWSLTADYNRSALPNDVHAQMSALKTAAFLVIHNGSIKREVYWTGFDAHSRINSNSVAKPIVATLIGIALAEGKLRSLDQPVSDFVPAFATGERAQLTIRHLLTMSAATDFSESYLSMLAFPARAHFGDDITKLLLTDFRIIAVPGKTLKYDSSNTALLGLVLTKATGMPLSDYAAEKLWQPLGAEQSALWSLDHANGMEKAYCCIYATARDFARLGQLYLQGGLWNGQQLVSARFVAEAISAAPLKDATGHKTERFGYQWWRMQHRGHTVYYGWGYQGQYVAVIPEKDLVMVRLGDGGGLTQDHYKLDLPLYLDAALDTL